MPRIVLNALIMLMLINHQGTIASEIVAVSNSSIAVDKSIVVDQSIVWALNVGGLDYLGGDGIAYSADQQISENKPIKGIRGAQDSSVFETYRSGELDMHHTIENGLYDLSFKFAEPDDVAIGERVFDVFAEGTNVISHLDVKQARDSQARSSVVRTIPNVEVSDGVLNINLKSIVGEPILNAIVVRKKTDVGSAWTLSWQDEFNYEGEPDSTKWTAEIWPPRKVNNEDQAYTSRLKNARVQGGVLVIEAHHESYQGAEYTSGRLHSSAKGDFLYGRVEIKAKLPAGQGTWPAIWMMPTDGDRYTDVCKKEEGGEGEPSCDFWPNSGEIDIMEHVGYDMNRVHGTVHNRAYYWVNGKQRKASIEAVNVDKEFHVYAMEWSPERIDVLYDEVRYFTYLNQGEGWRAWPFDHPYHLILNIAVGGGWGGAGGPNDLDAFPARMEIEYVRVYKKDLEKNKQ